MPRHRLSASLVFVAFTALAVAGCGGAAQTNDSSHDFQGEQRNVAKVIEDVETAVAKSRVPDAKKICTKLITDDLARKIAAQDPDHNCDDRLKESLKDVKLAGGVPELTVLKVTVNGDKAVASVKATNGDRELTSDYTLVRSGNSWRISGL